ncbi:MAG: YdcH family protein [Myxococcales bacterium]|nr:YdcH family protein [Myxococcales bacterium]
MPNLRVDVQAQIDRIQRKHSELAERIDAIDSRLHLTSDEQLHVNSLKKQKLAMKDRLSDLYARR